MAYKMVDGILIESETKEEPVFIPEIEIAELKKELDSSDYKVIKCYECQISGLPMPYDILGLHAERQAIRDKINILENGGQVNE